MKKQKRGIPLQEITTVHPNSFRLYHRKPTKTVTVGSVKIGGDNPIVIQSMTNTKTADVQATITQIRQLEEAGCELVRVAVPDTTSAEALPLIIKAAKIPVAADIHFDYKLALTALKGGVHKLRLNPGNIGSLERVKIVAQAAMERNVPIRIGVNAGSLEKDIWEARGSTGEALAESAMRHVEILERAGFGNIVISVKASSIPVTLRACEILSSMRDYPLHLGITEAGGVYAGSIKSAAGIGALLTRGLGDTIRVSLTGDPAEEVKCAREILRALALRSFGPEIISCPTCGRTEIDLIGLAERVEAYCQKIHKPLKIAVMGCVVNGPGEAREADLGVAGGRGFGLLFKKGEVIRKVEESKLFEAFIEEIDKFEPY